jgi:hypothetical protein
MNTKRPYNTSVIKDPKWTGSLQQYVIYVATGEPRRTKEQMREGVLEQANRWLTQFPPESGEVDPLVIIEAVDLIARDYIEPQGSQNVALTGEHFMLFVRAAEKRLRKVAS